MAESSLSIGLPELQAEVGFFLGYGRTSGNWSAAQLSEITGLVQSGVRYVYYPQAINKDMLGYEWSWLRPNDTLEVTSGTDDYDLPDDFGRLFSSIHYPADEHRSSLKIVSVGKLLAMRAHSTLTGAPLYAAIRYKASDGSDGQRQEVLLYPEPDDDWTMVYEYEAYSGVLSDANPYPLGGMQLAELYIASCLSVADLRINDEVGENAELFDRLLIDAVARDRKRGARVFGQMGHREQNTTRREFRRGLTGGTYPISYHGEDL